jgi:UDP-N-acetylmuramoyl-tripeptide--D-alanyl-D-alanine ligase
VGKTTSKDFTATLLEGKFRVGKNIASYNTKLTLPLTILNRKGDEEVLVLEMGMSAPGDIGRLLTIAPPDVALITKVSLAHAAFFPGGLQEIARGKAEIFSHPKTRAVVFDHAFHEFTEEVGKIKGDKWSFSLTERGADYFLSSHEDRFIVDERGVREYQFDLPFKQPHILHNFLAAASVARQMKMTWDEINQQIGKLQLPRMRFEQFEKGGISFVNDAYNANPESMRAALSSLPEPKEGGKRIAVLGTMKELGVFSETSHRDIGRLAQKYVDHLLVLGEEAAPLCEAFTEVKKPGECFSDHKSLAERLSALMSPGDVVLVKGSRSMKMETVFELLG